MILFMINQSYILQSCYPSPIIGKISILTTLIKKALLSFEIVFFLV